MYEGEVRNKWIKVFKGEIKRSKTIVNFNLLITLIL